MCLSTIVAFQAEAPTTAVGIIWLIVILQFILFLLSLWVLYKLWMTVFEFLAEKPTNRARILASVLGRAEVGGSGTNVKVKAIGVGLGGTVTILVTAVLAMYVLGHHVVR